MKFTSILKEPFNTLDTVSKLSVTAFYFAIVLVALVVIAAIFLKKAKPEKLQPFMKSVKYFVFGVATTFVVTMLTLKISDDVQGGSFVKEVFWPIMSIIIVAFALVAAGYVINTVKPEFMRKFKFIALFLILIPVIVSIAFLAVHFKKVGGDYEGVSQAGLYISAIVLVLILVVAATVFSKRNGPFTTREMAYAAISVALFCVAAGRLGNPCVDASAYAVFVYVRHKKRYYRWCDLRRVAGDSGSVDYPPRAVLPGLPDRFCNDGTGGNFQGTQHHQKARCRIYGRRNSCGYAEIFLARVLGHFRIRVLRSLGLFCGSVGLLVQHVYVRRRRNRYRRCAVAVQQ